MIQVDDNRVVPAGVVAAADDPPETTIEPHLEMSYNKEMPGESSVHIRFVNCRLSGSLKVKDQVRDVAEASSLMP